ncbi:WD domain-containing protein [Rasamsonia emersonii CBS 393.64]|uniref:WD domain-containing protein n=1 Tax=Rasamsonia emersonii (strain ATCC 16479 / CBS 393.64 / IMI 116815) TaxID=1408163 RepID=A0A0F4Z166_RASE3|nr:WD domain-containing protein [Rasamsonia emersonii CBS 393.64]KKA24239.1 WD domain-containing protein [Rasamsonia emersonii CBS 393.64]
MNLSLVDPFVLAQDYPDTLTGKLSMISVFFFCSPITRNPSYLPKLQEAATQLVYGSIAKGITSHLGGWSRCGRYLLSSSQDWKCILWDMKDGSRVRSVRFEAPVYIAELHPYNHWLFVASLFEDQPVLVDISSPKPIKRILPSAPLRPSIPNSNEADPSVAAKQAAQDAKHSTCVTIFTALGNHIIAGTSKGWINIIETQTCNMIHSTRLCNGVVILIRLASNGRDLLINSSDRVIRTVLMPDLSQLGVGLDPANIKLEVEHKFQDVVNRLSWNHVAFSSTGEFVMASTFMNPDIYIWERSHGSLVKILEGPREEMGVVEWHPSRPMIMVCGLESGCIYTWSIVTPQKWSALAPDFAEVEENVEYEEREDEYDIHPADEVHQRRLDQEDEVPDVLTIEPVKGDADGGLETFRMPVLLDISDSESEDDIVAVGPGTMRRRSPGAGREWAVDGDGIGDGGNGGGGGASSRAVTNGTARGHNRGRRKQQQQQQQQ